MQMNQALRLLVFAVFLADGIALEFTDFDIVLVDAFRQDVDDFSHDVQSEHTVLLDQLFDIGFVQHQ